MMYIEEDYLIKIPDNDTGFSEEIESQLRNTLTDKIENVFYRPSFRQYRITAVEDDLPRNFALHRPEVLSDLSAYSKMLKYNGMLNPEETNPAQQEFVVYDTSKQIVALVRTEHMKSYGVAIGLYTGIREGTILPGTIFDAVKLMRLIDFGNEEYESFQIFKPVFDNIKQNLTQLYDEYKDSKQAEEYEKEKQSKKGEPEEPEEDTQKANRKGSEEKEKYKKDKESPARKAGRLKPEKAQLAKLKTLDEVNAQRRAAARLTDADS